MCHVVSRNVFTLKRSTAAATLKLDTWKSFIIGLVKDVRNILELVRRWKTQSQNVAVFDLNALTRTQKYAKISVRDILSDIANYSKKIRIMQSYSELRVFSPNEQQNETWKSNDFKS